METEITFVERLVGNLVKNEIIKKEHLSGKKLLTFGQDIKVILINKNLTIKTRGQAQSNGSLGDSVTIRLANKKIVQGEITGKDLVNVKL